MVIEWWLLVHTDHLTFLPLYLPVFSCIHPYLKIDLIFFERNNYYQMSMVFIILILNIIILIIIFIILNLGAFVPSSVCKPNAFEIRAYRWMLKTFRMERRTNRSILAMLNAETRLTVVCKEWILRFFGHVIRRNGSSLEKLMIERKVEAKRSSALDRPDQDHHRPSSGRGNSIGWNTWALERDCCQRQLGDPSANLT